MTTTKNLFLFALILLFASGCNKDLKRELEQLRQDKQQMQSTIDEQNSTISAFRNTLNEVDQKFKTAIKDEEVLQKIEGEEDLNSRVKVLTEEINKLMQQNQEKLEAQNKNLSNSRYRISLLRKEVNKMQESIASKADSIKMFENRVVMQDDKISEMENQISMLKKKNSQQTEDIDDLDHKLNTVAYVIGTSGDLIEKGVIEKVGGFLGIFGRTEKLKSDFELAPFTTINRMDMTTIGVNTKKLEMITTHPSGSYELQMENNMITKLVITDPEKFWKASKFLVIKVR